MEEKIKEWKKDLEFFSGIVSEIESNISKFYLQGFNIDLVRFVYVQFRKNEIEIDKAIELSNTFFKLSKDGNYLTPETVNIFYKCLPKNIFNALVLYGHSFVKNY